MKMSQEKTFESEFQSYARETADIAENNAENTFGQLKTLATALTSIARDNDASENPNNTGAVFPEIVIPHFDLRTKEIADLTGIEMIVFAPFVDAAAKDSWEAHEVETQDWITQDYVSTRKLQLGSIRIDGQTLLWLFCTSVSLTYAI